ncbi:MAG: iron ABC transporter permease [Opitutaceae bacterium]|nr:iron ABC transporter permease [Opitutaceae bacterium]
MSKPLSIGIYICSALFFFGFFFWPISQILQGGFFDPDGNLTFLYFTEIFRNKIYLEGLLNSFLLAVFSTLLTFVIAIPLAFISSRFTFWGKQLLSSLILVPLILPPFVGAIGLRQIFGQYGALNALLTKLDFLAEGATIDWLGTNQFLGIVILNALHLYPILYLNAVAALSNVDPALEEAAANMGCSGFRRFFKVTLPLVKPGLFAGGTIIFIWSFTELGVPLVFDYLKVTPVQIFYGLKDIGGNPFPFALVAVMLIASVLFYTVGKGLFGRNTYAMMAKATSNAGPRKLPPLFSFLCTIFFASITLVAVLPHIGVILVSFSSDWYASIIPNNFTLDNYSMALGHSLTVPSIANSLKYASISSIVDIVLGLGIAYIIVRTKLPGRQILDAISMAPLAIPGLVLAFGYIAMSQEGKFFHFLNPIENPTTLLIIAYAVRRLPYMVRASVAGFQQISVTLEESAQNLGCPPLKSTIKITLPLVTANIIAGALLVFSFAMLEVSDSLILAQKQAFYPITKAIFELFQLMGDGRFIASALGVWAMLFLAATIGTLSLLLGKKLGAVFRV